jgi:hypothetical protein
MQIIRERATHSQQIERWLGKIATERLSQDMRRWPGPPIALAGVPGSVWAMPGGDFRGPIAAGQVGNITDFAIQRGRRILRDSAKRQRAMCHAGFSSLSDLISEATGGGKRYEFAFTKNGPTGVAAVTSSLWGLGAQPAAGANASAAPGGDSPTSATTGAFPYTNPTGGDYLIFTTAFPLSSVLGNTLLLYDRLFQVNKTMASTATESVTGTFSRYQNTTATAQDYIGGNFCFVEVGGTALAATAHNWTVCQYTNQAGTTAQSFPSMTGNSSAIVRRLDHPVGQWFMPFASGDSGVKALTQMQCSASVATGVINFVVGHPLAWMPCPVANMVCIVDGINSAFNMVRIFDSAALAFLEVCKPSTTATNYSGTFVAVAG